MDETVGNFQVGQIGLMMGSTLFAKAVFPQQSAKWKTAAPSVYGNIKTYDFILTLPAVESCLNLTILRPLTAALPEVPTENDLPPAAMSVYPVYLVRNHTEIGVPVLASRRNNQWYYSSARTVSGAGEGIISRSADKFHSSVKINMAVYWNHVDKLFYPADSSDPSGYKAPMGIRTSEWEITTLGPIKRHTADDIWPATLTPDTFLFLQSGANVGRPGTPASWFPYGYVMDNDTIWVDFDSMANFANGQSISTQPPNVGTHRHPNVTQTSDGFMSKEDKAKLDAPESFVIGQNGIRTGSLINGRVYVEIDPNTIDDALSSVITAGPGILVQQDAGNNRLVVRLSLGTGTQDKFVAS